MLTPVERVLILKGADLLKEAGPRQLLRLADVAREVEIAKGEVLYDEADPADALYMVVGGRVRLTSGGKIMSEVGPGEAFGTWALVDDSERGHRAECVEPGLVLALRREEFYDVAAGELTLLQQVVRVLAKRLRALVSQRPEEARVEGEGIEKPEALTESETPEILPAESGATSSPGASLTAAAIGQSSVGGESGAPVEPPTTSEIATPTPSGPVEPPRP